MATTDSPSRPKRRGLKIALGVFVAAVLLVALLPKIAGIFAPGIIGGAASKKLAGTLTVDKVGLSWFGSQKVGPIRLIDPSNPSTPVAVIDVTYDGGLAGLAAAGLGSSPNLKTVHIVGNANLVRGTDGRTNLERVMAGKDAGAPAGPGSSAPASPGQLPRGLKAHVVFTGDVAYSDASGQVGNVQIKGITADATIGESGGATIDVDAKTVMGSAPEGTLKIDAVVKDLTDAAGNLQPSKASVDANVESSGLPVAVVDALAGMRGKLVSALGPTLKVSLSAKGSLANADAKLLAESAGVNASLDANITDNVLTSKGPITINAKGSAVRALTDLDARLRDSGDALSVDTMPDVGVSVDSLKLRLPLDGKPLDLRGGSAVVRITTTQTTGKLKAGTAADAPRNDFSIAPLTATLTAPDLGGEVKLAAATSVTVAGQPGGALNIDLAAAGLLDKDGKPIAGIPPSLKGEAVIKGIATAIAQPFVGAMKLDLPKDIGPTLDAALKASTAGTGKDAAVSIDVALAAAKLNSTGSFDLAGGVLKTRGQGFTLRADQAGALAGRFMPEGWSLSPAGQVNIAATGVSVPFVDGDFSRPQLDKASASVDITTNGLSIANAQKGSGGTLDISALKLGASMAQGGTPKVQIDGQMAHQGRAFTAKGAFDLPGLIASDGKGGMSIAPDKVRPVGSLALDNVPTSLMQFAMAEPALERVIARTALPTLEAHALTGAALGYGELAQGARSPQPPAPSRNPAPPAAQPSPTPAAQPAATPAAPGAQPAAPPLDLARVIAEAVGPTVSVNLSSQKGANDALDLAATVASERTKADAKATLGQAALDLKGVNSTTKLTPALIDTLLATFAAQMSPRPALASATDIMVVVEPASIPLKAGTIAPDFAKAGAAKARVYFPGPLLVTGLEAKNEDGTSRSLGQVGVETFQVTAELPLSVVGAQSRWSKRVLHTASGKVITAPGQPALTLASKGSADLSGGGDGAFAVEGLDAQITLSDILPGRLDTITGKPGMLAGALGDKAQADITFSQKGVQAKTTEVSAAVTSPRVTMSEPIKLAMLPDRIASKGPFTIDWKMDPAFATQYLLGGDKAPDGPRIQGVTPVNVSVKKLVIATGEGNGPLKPGVFDLDLSAKVPTLDMLVPGGEQIKLGGTSVAVSSGDPGTVKFNLGVDQISSAKAGGGAAQKAALSGFVTGLADAKGNISADNTLLTANGEMPVIPTALIDAFAKQEGMIVDALGPTASVALKADKFGPKGGTLDLKANTPRASATVKGSVQDKIFVASEPVKVTLTEISPELTARFTKGLPFIGKIEKTSKDEPATFTATGLRAPMDGDMRKLNADVVLDLGQARVSSGGDFLGILKAVGVKKDAQVGKRIQPLNAAVREGVVKYQKWTVPVGEFDIDTEGSVDLAAKTLDVYTYLPIGALTDEAAGLFKLGGKDGIGGAIDKVLGGGKDGGNIIDAATKVPWRTRGTFGKTKTEPDLAKWGEQFIKQVPGTNIIDKGLESIFKKDKK